MTKRPLLLLLILWYAAVVTAQDTAQTAAIQQEQPPPDAAVTEQRRPSFQLLDNDIAAGENKLLQLTAGQSFFGEPLDIPVSVSHGANPGPVLCLIAAIHGDELNGIEAIRRIVEETDPGGLSGTLISIPVANVQGFAQGIRYLPDRRDLNRYFPGKPRGSLASRIAHLLFHNVIRHCEYLVDFHTGSFKRINLPQLRADMSNPEVRKLALNFSIPVLHKAAASGTLRGTAVANGIAAVTIELGEPSIIELTHVESGVSAIRVLMHSLRMFSSDQQPPPNFQATYYRSYWVRVNHGGIVTSLALLGEVVERNALIGISINPITNERNEIRAPVAGKILGMARNQFMLPGFAAFHIGRLSAEAAPAAELKSELSEESEMYD